MPEAEASQPFERRGGNVTVQTLKRMLLLLRREPPASWPRARRDGRVQERTWLIACTLSTTL